MKPETNLGLNRIQAHDLCDTDTVLFQLSYIVYQANWLQLVTL